MPRAVGPYQITTKIGDNAYKVDVGMEIGIQFTFNAGDLVPYQDKSKLRTILFEGVRIETCFSNSTREDQAWSQETLVTVQETSNITPSCDNQGHQTLSQASTFNNQDLSTSSRDSKGSKHNLETLDTTITRTSTNNHSALISDRIQNKEQDFTSDGLDWSARKIKSSQGMRPQRVVATTLHGPRLKSPYCLIWCQEERQIRN